MTYQGSQSSCEEKFKKSETLKFLLEVEIGQLAGAIAVAGIQGADCHNFSDWDSHHPSRDRSRVSHSLDWVHYSFRGTQSDDRDAQNVALGKEYVAPCRKVAGNCCDCKTAREGIEADEAASEAARIIIFSSCVRNLLQVRKDLYSVTRGEPSGTREQVAGRQSVSIRAHIRKHTVQESTTITHFCDATGLC